MLPRGCTRSWAITEHATALGTRELAEQELGGRSGGAGLFPRVERLTKGHLKPEPEPEPQAPDSLSRGARREALHFALTVG